MKISPAKENILKRVRNALSQSVQLPFPNSEGNSSVFRTENESLELKFAEEFTRLQGKFVYCTGKAELLDSLRSLCENKEWHSVFCKTPSLLKIIREEELPSLNKGTMHEADAAITDCEYLVARTGSVVLSSAQPSGRALPVYAPVHIMIAFTHQLVFDLSKLVREDVEERLIRHKIHTRLELSSERGYEIVLQMIEQHTSDLVSLMDHSPGQGQYPSAQALREYIAT